MRTWIMVLTAVALLPATVAISQPEPPHENHYKVFYAQPAEVVFEPLRLTDQFGSVDAIDFYLERWANPAEKFLPETGERFPPVDPVVHQMWWRFFAPQPSRTIVVIDQFGTERWEVRDAAYLVTPALKNVPGQPPVWNHYLCYDAFRPPVIRLVELTDQFGNPYATVVLHGRYFCNPVEKLHLGDGRVYPIVDAKAHLACYLLDQPDFFAQPITAIDQFGNWYLDVYQADCLCVPALKEHPVRTEESTWGKIKALYH